MRSSAACVSSRDEISRLRRQAGGLVRWSGSAARASLLQHRPDAQVAVLGVRRQRQHARPAAATAATRRRRSRCGAAACAPSAPRPRCRCAFSTSKCVMISESCSLNVSISSSVSSTRASLAMWRTASRSSFMRQAYGFARGGETCDEPAAQSMFATIHLQGIPHAGLPPIWYDLRGRGYWKDTWSTRPTGPRSPSGIQASCGGSARTAGSTSSARTRRSKARASSTSAAGSASTCASSASSATASTASTSTQAPARRRAHDARPRCSRPARRCRSATARSTWSC